VERLASLRAALRHAGAADTTGHDNVWAEAVDRTAAALWPDLAAAFAVSASQALERAPHGSLKFLLQSVGPALEIVRGAAARLSALGADGEAFFARVVAGSLEPLVEHAFQSLEADDSRGVVSASLAESLAQLADARVRALIPIERLVRWLAETLLRTDRRKPFRFRDRGAAPAYGHYRKMRKQMPSGTLAFTLIELVATFPGVRDAADPDAIVVRIARLVRTFPEDLRAQLLARDLEYVDAPITFLEGWWAELVEALPEDPGPALQVLMSSQFFSVTHDECALARFEQEARLVALVFEGAEIGPLLARTAALARTSTELVAQLSERRLDGLAPGPPARTAIESSG
jgi:hypothetical protein